MVPLDSQSVSSFDAMIPNNMNSNANVNRNMVAMAQYHRPLQQQGGYYYYPQPPLQQQQQQVPQQQQQMHGYYTNPIHPQQPQQYAYPYICAYPQHPQPSQPPQQVPMHHQQYYQPQQPQQPQAYYQSPPMQQPMQPPPVGVYTYPPPIPTYQPSTQMQEHPRQFPQPKIEQLTPRTQSIDKLQVHISNEQDRENEEEQQEEKEKEGEKEEQPHEQGNEFSRQVTRDARSTFKALLDLQKQKGKDPKGLTAEASADTNMANAICTNNAFKKTISNARRPGRAMAMATAAIAARGNANANPSNATKSVLNAHSKAIYDAMVAKQARVARERLGIGMGLGMGSKSAWTSKINASIFKRRTKQDPLQFPTKGNAESIFKAAVSAVAASGRAKKMHIENSLSSKSSSTKSL